VNRKWSWAEFIIGWINKQFLIWCVSTALVFFSLFTKEVTSEKIQFTTEKLTTALALRDH